MANFFTRVALFLSSFAPLFIVFAVKQYPHSHKSAYIFLGLAASSLIVLAVFIKTAYSINAEEVTVREHSAKDGDSMSYIVTYLVPFLDIKFDQFENLVGLAIVFLVVGILYVNSNMVYTNPVLNLVGFHIFDIRTTEDRPLVLITRQSFVKSNAKLSVAMLGNYAAFEVKQK